jgi:hypothetical protein
MDNQDIEKFKKALNLKSLPESAKKAIRNIILKHETEQNRGVVLKKISEHFLQNIYSVENFKPITNGSNSKQYLPPKIYTSNLPNLKSYYFLIAKVLNLNSFNGNADDTECYVYDVEGNPSFEIEVNIRDKEFLNSLSNVESE